MPAARANPPFLCCPFFAESAPAVFPQVSRVTGARSVTGAARRPPAPGDGRCQPSCEGASGVPSSETGPAGEWFGTRAPRGKPGGPRGLKGSESRVGGWRWWWGVSRACREAGACVLSLTPWSSRGAGRRRPRRTRRFCPAAGGEAGRRRRKPVGGDPSRGCWSDGTGWSRGVPRR